MKKFFRTLVQSFYSKELYQDAAYKWQGTGIGLIAWVAIFGTLMLGISLALVPTSGYKEFKTQLIQQFPQVTLENGEISIDKPSPYYFNFAGENKIAMIDTSDATATLSLDAMMKKMEDEHIMVMATKNKIVVIKSDGESRIYDLSESKSKEKVTFGKTEVAELVKTVEIFIVPFMLVFTFAGLFLYKIIQMLLYSIFTSIAASMMKVKLQYNGLQRITTVALFPATVIGAVLALVGDDIPLILCIAVTFALILFGLKSAKMAAPTVA